MSLLQASSNTSVIYVPGVTLTVVLRKLESITTTWEAMVKLEMGRDTDCNVRLWEATDRDGKMRISIERI